MKKNNTYRWFWFISMLFVMAVIFWFSAQNGEESSEMSMGAERILALLHLDWLITPAMVHGIQISLRKWAHIYVYMMLGICSGFWTGSFSISRWKQEVYAGGICLFYSMSDEFHQTMVPGRCGTWKDLLYDGSGWLAGVTFSVLICLLISEVKKRRG